MDFRLLLFQEQGEFSNIIRLLTIFNYTRKPLFAQQKNKSTLKIKVLLLYMIFKENFYSSVVSSTSFSEFTSATSSIASGSTAAIVTTFVSASIFIKRTPNVERPV